MTDRDTTLSATDSSLLAECRMEFFKASGNGGQKRNKCSTAVRLTHLPTGVAVTDCSTRSQHRNRAECLRKLRREIAFSVRQPCAGLDIAAFRPGDPVQLAALFDLLCSHNWDPALAAEELAVSKSFLLKQIGRDTAVFARFNEFRVQAGKPPLRL